LSGCEFIILVEDVFDQITGLPASGEVG